MSAEEAYRGARAGDRVAVEVEGIVDRVIDGQVHVRLDNGQLVYSDAVRVVILERAAPPAE